MLREVVEIEAGGPGSPALYYPPLQRKLRGSLEPRDVRDPAAVGPLLVQWPGGIPGQVLGLRPDGTAYLREPLHQAEHSETRRKVEAQHLTLPPELEELGPADVCTFVHWMRRSVQEGMAKVVKGQLPESVPGKPRLQFIAPERSDPKDERLARLEKQNERLTALLVAMLPADKRRALEKDLNGE